MPPFISRPKVSNTNPSSKVARICWIHIELVKVRKVKVYHCKEDENVYVYSKCYENWEDRNNFIEP